MPNENEVSDTDTDEVSDEEFPAHEPDQWKIWAIAFVVLGTTLALALLI